MGEGIGEALTRHVIGRAREQGLRSVVLSSSTTMHAAHRLYERLGFTPAARARLVTGARRPARRLHSPPLTPIHHPESGAQVAARATT